ncbi:MAG TPA: HAD-IC family P-type ATPase [Clostridia bacterium]|nr:HAD-IC family P-type ATPase [Clostridia bacterium]
MEEKLHKHAEDCCANDGCEACKIASGEQVPKREQGETKKELFVLGGGAVLFAAGLLLKSYETVSFILLLLAYALLGAEIIYHAIKGLFAGNFMDENMLMSVATVGALALGDTAEAAGVMLFYRVGELLQELAVDRSRRSIEKAINMRPDKARVLRDIEMEVEPIEVEIGERILVKPGERIPLDGVVESGESYLDYSVITGESAPVFIEAGSEAMSGGINKNGALTIKVTRGYEQSTVSRIMEAVEDAVKNKPRLQGFISRFSRIYTPIVIALAALVAIAPPLLGLGAFRDWLYKALLFLVISCPCALVLSVPLIFFAGLANASSKGVLFKGANILETVANAKAFAFDKTGTLTKGVFRVSKVVPADGQNEKEVLAYAAALERMSTHPVGRALVEADERHYTTEHVTELAGRGVSGTVDGKAVLAGNAKLMELNEIAMPERARRAPWCMWR